MNGGDLRQSVYRAIRHGLMQAHSMLLEPFYAFHLTIPDKMVGRAMTDLERRFAVFEGPVLEDGQAILTGRAPASSLDGYQTEVTVYTSGLGQLVCTLDGYGPCHNEEEVIEAAGYDPDADLNNPTGSVFCAHGAGFTVSWDQVKEHMQVESPIQLEQRRSREFEAQVQAARTAAENRKSTTNGAWGALDKELEAIFTRTYGEKRKMPPEMNVAKKSFL